MERTLAEELRLSKVGNIAKLGAIIVFFAIAYYPVFIILNAKYSEIDSYYSHGYLVPFISALIIWHKRNKLKDMLVVPSRLGFWVLSGGLLFYLFSAWWYVNFLSAFSMLIVLSGLCLYLFGKKITGELLFPIAFLFFMIPLPKITIIYITFWLKLFAAAVAAKVVSFIGIPAIVKGAIILLPQNMSLEVENACSGLRSLISLLALGAAYAYFLKVRLLKKCIFFLSSLPIATAANLIRIVIVTLIYYIYRPSANVFKRVDTITGLSVFVFAFIGLSIMGKWVASWGKR
ncbi:MAG: exosortase/archaeosortase family protein [Candidatus Omnitrophota bacterium]